jgi:cytochrome c-type biogenesis protein CcmH/NrfG
MATNRMERIRSMLAEEPNDPELRYMLAMEFASQGDDAAAVAAFEELIAVAPTYAPGYHMGARALQRLDRITEAKAMLQKGIPAALQQGNHHAAGEMQELLAMLD